MDTHTIEDFLALLGISAVFGIICHRTKTPLMVGFIFAGMLVGPFGSGIVDSLPGAEIITELGVILLLFTIGLEFSLGDLLKNYRRIISMGGLQVLITLVLCACLFHYVGDYRWPLSIFLGCLTSLSSTAIVMKLLQDSRELASPYGNATTNVLLFQDLAVIPMTLAIPLFITGHSVAKSISHQEVLLWGGKFILVAIAIGLGSRYVFPYGFEKVVRTRSRELFIFTVLFVCFGLALVFEEVGLSLSFGAFLAGMMVADSPYGKQAAADILTWRDSFLALFFASVGMLIDLKFVAENLLIVVGLVLVMFAVKAIVILVTMMLHKQTRTTSLMSALILAQIGEFSFILADLGHKQELISNEILQYFLSVSIVSMILTPFVFRIAPKFLINSRDKKQEGERPGPYSPHVLIIGFGVAGQSVAKRVRNHGCKFAIVEQNFAMVKKWKHEGWPIVFGDATNSHLLEELHIEAAKLVIIAVSGLKMTRTIVEQVRAISPNAKILVRVQYTQEIDNLPENFPLQDVTDAEDLAAQDLANKTESALALAYNHI